MDTVTKKARRSRLDYCPSCSVEAAISLIDGKWKCVILFHLRDGTVRFNEIRRRLPGLTPRMLTNQLRELEVDGIIVRKVYAQVPPKVEYSLSPFGRTLEPVLDALKVWGDANIGRFAQANPGSGGMASGASGSPCTKQKIKHAKTAHVQQPVRVGHNAVPSVKLRRRVGASRVPQASP